MPRSPQMAQPIFQRQQEMRPFSEVAGTPVLIACRWRVRGFTRELDECLFHATALVLFQNQELVAAFGRRGEMCRAIIISDGHLAGN